MVLSLLIEDFFIWTGPPLEFGYQTSLTVWQNLYLKKKKKKKKEKKKKRKKKKKKKTRNKNNNYFKVQTYMNKKYIHNNT